MGISMSSTLEQLQEDLRGTGFVIVPLTERSTTMKKLPKIRRKGPNPVDVHVGKRANERRVLLGMSQMQLADKLGVTFQQVQKYLTGANRISASRLWNISRALDVPVSYFFMGLDTEVDGGPDGMNTNRSTLELVRSIGNCGPGVQKPLRSLLKAISNETRVGAD
jgi:transcriptional regulator with XRE-family HTH domain